MSYLGQDAGRGGELDRAGERGTLVEVYGAAVEVVGTFCRPGSLRPASFAEEGGSGGELKITFGGLRANPSASGTTGTMVRGAAALPLTLAAFPSSGDSDFVRRTCRVRGGSSGG